MRKALSVITLVLCAVLVMPASSTNALFINVENQFVNSVFDTFSSIRTPDPNKSWDYWWRTLNTIVPVAGRVENQDCSGGPNGDANCVIAMSEGWNDFARFRLRPGKQLGEFYLAQLSDIRDSSPQSTPKRWKAEPGKPVVMTTRVRFSENYNPEGTDANGSAGFGFWNMPTETLDEFPFIQLHPAKAIWFTYTQAESIAGYTGYTANYVDHEEGFLPVFNYVRNFNMNDWSVQSIVWSIDSNGKDNVKFYINTDKVAEFTLNNPLPALSVEIWLDSSLIDPEAPGGVTVSQPEEEQFMDMDFLSVIQLGV